MIRYAAFATGFSANLPVQSIAFSSLMVPHARALVGVAQSTLELALSPLILVRRTMQLIQTGNRSTAFLIQRTDALPPS